MQTRSITVMFRTVALALLVGGLACVPIVDQTGQIVFPFAISIAEPAGNSAIGRSGLVTIRWVATGVTPESTVELEALGTDENGAPVTHLIMHPAPAIQSGTGGVFLWDGTSAETGRRLRASKYTIRARLRRTPDDPEPVETDSPGFITIPLTFLGVGFQGEEASITNNDDPNFGPFIITDPDVNFLDLGVRDGDRVTILSGSLVRLGTFEIVDAKLSGDTADVSNAGGNFILTDFNVDFDAAGVEVGDRLEILSGGGTTAPGDYTITAISDDTPKVEEDDGALSNLTGELILTDEDTDFLALGVQEGDVVRFTQTLPPPPIPAALIVRVEQHQLTLEADIPGEGSVSGIEYAVVPIPTLTLSADPGDSAGSRDVEYQIEPGTGITETTLRVGINLGDSGGSNDVKYFLALRDVVLDRAGQTVDIRWGDEQFLGFSAIRLVADREDAPLAEGTTGELSNNNESFRLTDTGAAFVSAGVQEGDALEVISGSGTTVPARYEITGVTENTLFLHNNAGSSQGATDVVYRVLRRHILLNNRNFEDEGDPGDLFEWDGSDRMGERLPPGEYSIVAIVNPNAIAINVINDERVTVRNAHPVMSITEPASNTSVPAGGTIDIAFQADDPDDAARVHLFARPDDGDTVTIVRNLSEDASRRVFTWDTTGTAAGSYTIFGIITDDEHPEISDDDGLLRLVGSDPALVDADRDFEASGVEKGHFVEIIAGGGSTEPGLYEILSVDGDTLMLDGEPGQSDGASDVEYRIVHAVAPGKVSLANSPPQLIFGGLSGDSASVAPVEDKQGDGNGDEGDQETTQSELTDDRQDFVAAGIEPGDIVLIRDGSGVNRGQYEIVEVEETRLVLDGDAGNSEDFADVRYIVYQDIEAVIGDNVVVPLMVTDPEDEVILDVGVDFDTDHDNGNEIFLVTDETLGPGVDVTPTPGVRFNTPGATPADYIVFGRLDDGVNDVTTVDFVKRLRVRPADGRPSIRLTDVRFNDTNFNGVMDPGERWVIEWTALDVEEGDTISLAYDDDPIPLEATETGAISEVTFAVAIDAQEGDGSYEYDWRHADVTRPSVPAGEYFIHAYITRQSTSGGDSADLVGDGDTATLIDFDADFDADGVTAADNVRLADGSGVTIGVFDITGVTGTELKLGLEITTGARPGDSRGRGNVRYEIDSARDNPDSVSVFAAPLDVPNTTPQLVYARPQGRGVVDNANGVFTLFDDRQNFLAACVGVGNTLTITGGDGANTGDFEILAVTRTRLFLDADPGGTDGEARAQYEITGDIDAFVDDVKASGSDADVANGPDRLTDADADFVAAGVQIGDVVTITAGTGANPGTYGVTAVAATSLTLDGDAGDSGGAGDVVYSVSPAIRQAKTTGNAADVSNAGANFTLTDPAADFVTDGVQAGDFVAIQSGGGSTLPGVYEITNVAANTLTLADDAGDSGGSGDVVYAVAPPFITIADVRDSEDQFTADLSIGPLDAPSDELDQQIAVDLGPFPAGRSRLVFPLNMWEDLGGLTIASGRYMQFAELRDTVGTGVGRADDDINAREMRVLASGNAGTTTGSPNGPFRLTDNAANFSQVQVGDLVIIQDGSAAQRGIYKITAVDTANKRLTLAGDPGNSTGNVPYQVIRRSPVVVMTSQTSRTEVRQGESLTIQWRDVHVSGQEVIAIYADTNADPGDGFGTRLNPNTQILAREDGASDSFLWNVETNANSSTFVPAGTYFIHVRLLSKPLSDGGETLDVATSRAVVDVLPQDIDPELTFLRPQDNASVCDVVAGADTITIEWRYRSALDGVITLTIDPDEVADSGDEIVIVNNRAQPAAPSSAIDSVVWNLDDADGTPVPTGQYLIRGRLKVSGEDPVDASPPCHPAIRKADGAPLIQLTEPDTPLVLDVGQVPPVIDIAWTTNPPIPGSTVLVDLWFDELADENSGATVPDGGAVPVANRIAIDVPASAGGATWTPPASLTDAGNVNKTFYIHARIRDGALPADDDRSTARLGTITIRQP